MASNSQALVLLMPALLREYATARNNFAPFNSAHEAYAVLLEEVDELWAEIKAKDYDNVNIAKEALQVATMALALILECTSVRDFERRDVKEVGHGDHNQD